MCLLLHADCLLSDRLLRFVLTLTWSVDEGGTGRRVWVCVCKHVVQWVVLVCVQCRVLWVEITKVGYQLQEPGKLEQSEIHRAQIKSKRHRERREGGLHLKSSRGTVWIITKTLNSSNSPLLFCDRLFVFPQLRHQLARFQPSRSRRVFVLV